VSGDLDLRALADLLAYPGPDLGTRATTCAAELDRAGSPAAAPLSRFAAWASAAGAGPIEEAYTSAFDLAPICTPYVGDQLFGASGERSLLLAGLRELQRDAGIAPGAELPDHVAEVLRLAAGPVPPDVRADLLRDGLAPALRKMLSALETTAHPWTDAVAAALDAVEALLPPARDASAIAGPAPRQAAGDEQGCTRPVSISRCTP
jgi:nitrate reductase delta subunit